MAKGTKAAARAVLAEYQAAKRERGEPIPETYIIKGSGEVQSNHIFISVAALNALERAVRGEDTLAAMKRSFKGGAS